MVAKKWTYIRDAWMRSYKKHKNEKKSGAAARSSKLYVYHEQMLFLKKITETRPTHDSADNTDNIEIVDEARDEELHTKRSNRHLRIEETLQQCGPNKSKKHKGNDVESKMIQFLDSRIMSGDSNRHLSFFNGVLPSLNSFSDEDTLEFQAGVLSLIQSIKRRRSESSQDYNTNRSYYSPVLTQPSPNISQPVNHAWQYRHGYFSQPQLHQNFTHCQDQFSSQQPAVPTPLPSPAMSTHSTQSSYQESSVDLDFTNL